MLCSTSFTDNIEISLRGWKNSENWIRQFQKMDQNKQAILVREIWKSVRCMADF